jgi:two-component system LytT family response regulator
MKLIIVDDQVLAREKTRMLLENYAPNVQILAEADGVRAGLACIQEHQPELVLLDVEMEDGTGFDLLSLCPEINFKVIFITGHNAFAIRAFKFSAIDYLLKPIALNELLDALKKAESELNQTKQNALSVDALLQNKQAEGKSEKLVLSDAEHIYLLDKSEIIRCQSEGNYTKFYLTEDRTMLIAKTLKSYVALLDGGTFFRPHRSHFINLLHFDKYDKRDGGIIYMKDKSSLPVAMGRKDFLLKALQTL